MRFSLVMSEICIIPSMPSPISTNAPNGVRFVIGTFHHGAYGIFLWNAIPGIAQRLLVAEADTPLGRIYLQNHRLHALAHFQQIARLANALFPGQLGQMNQAVDAGQQFDEGAEISQPRNRSAHAVADMKLARRDGPWVFLQLLEAERNLSCWSGSIFRILTSSSSPVLTTSLALPTRE